MTVLAEDEVKRPLVVIVHPHDVEFWAGGAIACWTDAGVAVTYQYCVLTDEGRGRL